MTITEQPDTTTGPAIGFSDVQAAAERLRGVAHHTPVLTSRTLDAMTGAQVYLKAEPFQRIGAFKFRGAYNAISALEPEIRIHGVVTNSSGNHAQAVALSAQLFGIPATIVMPTDAPRQDCRHTRLWCGDRLLRSLQRGPRGDRRTRRGRPRSDHDPAL